MLNLFKELFKKKIPTPYQNTGRVLWVLSDVNGKNYATTTIPHHTESYGIKGVEEEIVLNEQQIATNDNIKVYGWAIEMRFTNIERCQWSNHWNHVIYNSRDNALEAIMQFKGSGIYNNIEFRILPLYNINQEFWRDIKIYKILKDI